MRNLCEPSFEALLIPNVPRSSSTGSTSSGISSDLHSLVSPEPGQDSKTSSSSSLKPPLPPKRTTTKLPVSSAPAVEHGINSINSINTINAINSIASMMCGDQHSDNNSDTGLSSLNSSAEEQYTLDTLV